MINTKVPRPWESRVNGLIGDTAGKYPNIVFVDWKGQGDAHKEWFWNDGIHLRPEGAAIFAELDRPGHRVRPPRNEFDRLRRWNLTR